LWGEKREQQGWPEVHDDDHRRTMTSMTGTTIGLFTVDIFKPFSAIPSWTLTTTITVFHTMSCYSSSLSNLDPQASSDAFNEQEMRAQFTELGLDWNPGDEAPLEEGAHQPTPLDITGLLSSMAAQAIAPEFSIPTQVFKEPTVTLPSPTPVKPLADGAQQPIDPWEKGLFLGIWISLFLIFSTPSIATGSSPWTTSGPRPSQPKRLKTGKFFGWSSLPLSMLTWSSVLLHLCHDQLRRSKR
jgi:hypothetical protein